MPIYLILSMAFTTVFASCYKIAVRKKCNVHVVNAWLYVGSTLAALGYVILKGELSWVPGAAWLGVAGGIMVFFATLAFFYHMRRGQLSVSWTVISLSVGFPVLASIFFWHEVPTPRQTMGMLLIVFALGFFGWHEKNGGEEAR